MTKAMYLAAQARTLAKLHDTLFAREYRLLETYGEPKASKPTDSQIVADATATIRWHEEKSVELAAEVSERRKALPKDQAVYDEAVRVLAHHRNEIDRIRGELASLTEPHLKQAAE